MTSPLPTFQPGERVAFCGEEAVVIADYGTQIAVKVVEPNGDYTTMAWYKVFQGEPVVLVGKN